MKLGVSVETGPGAHGPPTTARSDRNVPPTSNGTGDTVVPRCFGHTATFDTHMLLAVCRWR